MKLLNAAHRLTDHLAFEISIAQHQSLHNSDFDIAMSITLSEITKQNIGSSRSSKGESGLLLDDLGS